MNVPTKLTDHVAYWVRLVSNANAQRIARQAGVEDLTVAEWPFLRVLLDAEGLTPTVIAERMAMTKGGVSKLSERLITKGLVIRSANGASKKSHKLSLTSQGREKAILFAKIVDHEDREYFGVLSPDERQALISLLSKVVDRNSADT